MTILTPLKTQLFVIDISLCLQLINIFTINQSVDYFHDQIQLPKAQDYILKCLVFSNQQYKSQRHSISGDIKL